MSRLAGYTTIVFFLIYNNAYELSRCWYSNTLHAFLFYKKVQDESENGKIKREYLYNNVYYDLKQDVTK